MTVVVDEVGPPWEGLSDGDLLTLAADDTGAFDVFYDRHVVVVLGYLYKRTGCVQTAADLTAETFAAAFVGRNRYRDTGAPAGAWLLGIARHQLFRWYRRGQVPDRARKKLGMERLEVDDLSYERIETLIDLAPLRRALDAAMATLSPKLAEAVMLRIGLDMSYTEVAQRLNVTEGAVRTRVARGLHQLTERLEMQ